MVKGIAKLQPVQQDRGAIVPHDWLPGLHEVAARGLDPTQLKAVTMIAIMQFFGWRANTVVGLKTSDVSFMDGTFIIRSSVFKTVGPGGYPMGVLKITKLPWIMHLVGFYLAMAPDGLFFGANKDPPFQVCQQALRTIALATGRQPP